MDLPKPSEPHEKLDTLAGTWIGEEKWLPSKLQPRGAHASAVFDFHKDVDGFFLLADYSESIEGKRGIRGHGVIGWDPKEKSYTFHWFDNFGKPPAAPGRAQWENGKLAFEHDYGKGPRGRTIFDLDGKNTFNFRIEMSEDGKTWNPTVEGRYRRR